MATMRRATRRRRTQALPLRTPSGKANYAYPRGVGPNAGRHPSYPIDPQHVRGSLSYSGQARTAGNYATVAAAVVKRYGSISAAMAQANKYPGMGPYVSRPQVAANKRKRRA